MRTQARTEQQIINAFAANKRTATFKVLNITELTFGDITRYEVETDNGKYNYMYTEKQQWNGHKEQWYNRIVKCKK